MRAPAGLARTAGRLHRRRRAARAAVAGGTAAVTAAARGRRDRSPRPAQTGRGAAQARTVAYVTSRVENALASQNMVYAARTQNSDREIHDHVGHLGVPFPGPD